MKSKTKNLPNAATPRELPFRPGSWLHYCFERALQGVDADDLKTTLRYYHRSWRFNSRVLMSGDSSWYRRKQGTGIPRKIFIWKFEMKNGFIRIYDLKRVI